MFIVGPVIFAMWLSLHEWPALGDMTFVGLRNYVWLFTDPLFGAAAVNTLFYVALALVAIMPLSLLIASVLNSRGVRFKNFFRTVYFVPIILSGVVVSLVFNIIFARQSGLLNAVLGGLVGLPPLGWLETSELARWAILIVMLWRYTGYVMIFFLAGLQNVPQEQYEAVALDGGGVWRSFTTVTLPALKPVSAFVVVIVIAGTSQIFEEPFILTAGGPDNSTISVAVYIYRIAFQQGLYGEASAAGIVLFVAVFFLSRLMTTLFGIGGKDE
ncbi:carbohydrate ABC transporter permease [Microbacterium sp. NPDC057650]|uniref:carbohydrate ABC transporter permease n=1 Tax=unclassified Microbacterium TaxID=2609290 RepID=UPI00366E68A8